MISSGKFFVLMLVLVSANITPRTASAQNNFDVDICVFGGTSAGVIAAYTAAKYGKSVLLVVPGTHIGGLSSGGLGYTDIGNKYAVTGLARQFYRKIGQHYGKFEHWIFEPHVAENIFREYISRGNVPVLYDYQLTSVRVKERAVTQLALDHVNGNKSGPQKIVKAKIFIDCSYEGDLMARAGVSYVVGREANSKYGETYNGVQVLDKHQFPDGIDPYKIPGKPESGLLWGISNEKLPPAGSGDLKVQAYNFRICLTSDPANRIEITKPVDYDSSRYELLIRLLEKEHNRPFNLILKPDLMPNNKTDINNNGPFSTDMIGMNYKYPEADYEERKKIIKSHENYTKGLLYFIGHSKRVPLHLRTEMLRWGYPKDEYVRYGNWSPQIYVREARRMVGEYVMTQANCEGRASVDDGVGMAAYTMDSHNTSRVVINGMVKNEGDVQVGGFPPYPISYRSIIPKANECTNLYVPVCLSATHISYGSIRMEPVFMVLGQSAAVGASMAIDEKVGVQQVDVKALQKQLHENPLADGSTAEILIDNDDSENVSVNGTWTIEKKGRGMYGRSLLTSDGSEKSSVAFTPDIQKGGSYTVYAYFPRLDGASNEVKVAVGSGNSFRETILDISKMKVEGQTSGEWVPLGSYVFQQGKGSSVVISGGSKSGFVIADAVLIVPQSD